MRTDELDYPLPEEAIATRPCEPRESARLMVVSRTDANAPRVHARIGDLPEFLKPRDLLVMNASRVLPARFAGRNAQTGGAVQGLFLRLGQEAGTWEVLLKARRFRPGATLVMHGRDGGDAGVTLVLQARLSGDEGGWLVKVEGPEDALQRIGLTPLPPYILSARKRAGEDVSDDLDREWYQTAYARTAGSVAAPTAGLHFTPRLLEALQAQGVARAEVLLHVGTGTFKPVETDVLEEHPMHTEWCEMPRSVLESIEACRAAGGRSICVGTTSARTVESYASWQREHGGDGAWPTHLETRLLISSGYRWVWTDGLLTNFHLPRSTLLAMVGAMVPGGVAQLKALYAEAIGRGYRFYSYGDAMLIV